MISSGIGTVVVHYFETLNTKKRDFKVSLKHGGTFLNSQGKSSIAVYHEKRVKGKENLKKQ